MYKRGVNTLFHYDPMKSALARSETIVVEVVAKLPPLMGKNTCCCGPENCFRVFC